MTDFQVVNGCQTSHVLYENSALLSEAVRIPIRIICTQDEAVIESTDALLEQFGIKKPSPKGTIAIAGGGSKT